MRRVAVEVVSTVTSADVMWKDGRLETGIRSNDLIPIQHLDNHEFCPGDYVVDKRRMFFYNTVVIFNMALGLLVCCLFSGACCISKVLILG